MSWNFVYNSLLFIWVNFEVIRSLAKSGIVRVSFLTSCNFFNYILARIYVIRFFLDSQTVRLKRLLS